MYFVFIYFNVKINILKYLNHKVNICHRKLANATRTYNIKTKKKNANISEP